MFSCKGDHRERWGGVEAQTSQRAKDPYTREKQRSSQTLPQRAAALRRTEQSPRSLSSSAPPNAHLAPALTHTKGRLLPLPRSPLSSSDPNPTSLECPVQDPNPHDTSRSLQRPLPSLGPPGATTLTSGVFSLCSASWEALNGMGFLGLPQVCCPYITGINGSQSP